ncbi:MAG: adenosine deaminase [Litorilinea sp.]
MTDRPIEQQHPQSTQIHTAHSDADFIRAIPKAELHVHLEGSITPETLLALAHRNHKVDLLPSTDPDQLRAWFKFTNFPHFVEVYLTICQCICRAEDFAFIVEAYAATAAAQSITYAEITTTPFIHTHIQKKGLTIDQILRGLAEGRKTARARYGIELNWVFDIPRNFSFRAQTGVYDPTPADITLDYAMRGRKQGVIGFGLGGDEVGAPAFAFAHAFQRAISNGLVSLPHAGETQGPESVWSAVQDLRAARIGHGVRAIEDPDLLSVLRVAQIPLEVNISSNICLHIYDNVYQHPFPQLDQMGLLVTINSDDPPLFNTTLIAEYTLLQSQFAYARADVARIARNAFLAMAQPSAVRRQYLARFDAWAAAHLNP